MSELHDLTALEQAAAIRAREVSAVELAEHYLRRAEALSDTVGAYLVPTPELALEQARAADAEAADGSVRSVLHGVVVPPKGLNQVAGVRSTLGSAAIDFVPHADDNPVSRMRAGGLVFTGTTNTPEFGLPCYTENAIAPPARTPWDVSRSAGGSSGGAAAAVATGLAAAAQGSDGGGSIRIPASVCGLVGIKPSRGRVSNGPVADPVGDLPHVGPLARTVADAAALLDVLSGAFPGDPCPAPPLPAGETFRRSADRDPPPLRIGRYRDPVVVDTELDPEVVAAYEEATALLTDLGHVVEDIERPFGPEAVPNFEATWSVLALLTPVPADREDELRPLTQWLRERGRAVTGLDLARSVSAMRIISRAAIAASAAYDAVLTPTLAKIPALVGGLRDDADPAGDFRAQKEFTPFTSPYNVTGQPAISVPLHMTGSGLPIGVQLVGKPYAETTIISLAAQMERARPWVHRRHELW